MNISDIKVQFKSVMNSIKQGKVPIVYREDKLNGKSNIENIDSKPTTDEVNDSSCNLGKRAPFGGVNKKISDCLKEVKGLKKISHDIYTNRIEKEEHEKEWNREYRIKLEIWKKYMIKRNPSSVSFKVHNSSVIAERYTSII